MPGITVELLSGRPMDRCREFAAAVTGAAVNVLTADRTRCSCIERTEPRRGTPRRYGQRYGVASGQRVID